MHTNWKGRSKINSIHWCDQICRKYQIIYKILIGINEPHKVPKYKMNTQKRVGFIIMLIKFIYLYEQLGFIYEKKSMQSEEEILKYY